MKCCSARKRTAFMWDVAAAFLVTRGAGIFGYKKNPSKAIRHRWFREIPVRANQAPKDSRRHTSTVVITTKGPREPQPKKVACPFR